MYATQSIYRASAILINIPVAYFTKQEQIIQKNVCGNTKDPKATAILRKKNKVGGIMLPNTKIYYKAIVINTAWYWRRTDTQINGTEWRTQK